MASSRQGYVFAGAEAGGLFRMPIGNGDSWENVTAGLPRAAAVRAVAVHPQDPDTVFAGTQHGPFRSHDGGAKFERLDFADTYMVGWSFQFDPHNPDIVYFGTSPAQVYRSDNGGDSWESLGLNQGSDVVTMDFPTRLIAMTVDPADSNLIYAALEVGGVVRSRDGGRSWQDCKEGMAPDEGRLDMHGIVTSPSTPGSVYITTRPGPFTSQNQGDTWDYVDMSDVSPITYTREMKVAPHDPNTIYVAMGRAAVSHNGALWRTKDLMGSWERMDHGMEAHSTMMSVDINRARPEQVFCATRSGEVFGTLDDGANWTAYPLPEHAREIRTVACG